MLPSALNTLVRHVELVLSANQRVNLTRVVEPAAALRLHTADSLSILEDVDAAPPGPLLDLGSGAGFPGIPLAVCTDRHATLLDSVGKKVRELGSIIVDLGLADQRRCSSLTRGVFGPERARALRCGYGTCGVGASGSRRTGIPSPYEGGQAHLHEGLARDR